MSLKVIDGTPIAISKYIREQEKGIIDYYYNPNVECTCEAIFDDTHRSYCKRRIRPESEVVKR